MTPTGLTKDSGWQIGVRRTLPLDRETAWELLISDRGLALWLGEISQIDLVEEGSYTLVNGMSGEFRVFKPYSHLRLTWQPPDWPRPSTIQVRVIPKGEKAVIAFHQEHMPSEAARVERRAHFKGALDSLSEMIE